MKIVRSIKQMVLVSKGLRATKKSVGFVPTMGALHEGHLSLIRACRRDNDVVVVSIFVNPAQFGPGEDLKKYPRNLGQDARLCARAGVDILFFPKANDIYPHGYKTYVHVEKISDIMCGKVRPGHFEGVATVVTKLFNIVQPEIAYLGQKDAQQVIVIKRLVEDMNMPVRIKVCPTVREKDGLAMSSRNVYLGQKERKDAVIIYQALQLAKELIAQKEKRPGDIIRAMRRLISSKKNIKVQYICVTDVKDLNPLDKINGQALISVAVVLNKTRLIDNIIVHG